MNLSKARAIETYQGRSRMRWVIIGLILVTLIGLGVLGAREIGLTYTPLREEADSRTITIESGSGAADIANRLEQEQIIMKARSFKLAVLFKGARGQLKAGTYELSAALSPGKIVEIIKQGKTKQIKVSVPEGLRLEQVANIFANADLGQQSDFLQAAAADKYDYPFLKGLPSDASLEGFLFPDTYYFAPEATGEEIIDKMLINFEEHITTVLPLLQKSDLSLAQTITLASMIEKEVSDDKDRRLVAGVFLNRLREGMPLQSDSTLAYIKKEEKINFSGEDVALDDPYNTYQNIGLPPGPINSPGLAAIKAVLEPTDSEYYYFVSDVKTGKTYYAKALDEHNQNVAKYLE